MMSSESLIYHKTLINLDNDKEREEIYLQNAFPRIKIINHFKFDQKKTYKFQFLLFYAVLILCMNLSLSLAETNFDCPLTDHYEMKSRLILNESTIHFVCRNLTNVCERLCFVRNNLRFELCDQISLLYLLPNTISNKLIRQPHSQCHGLAKNSFYTDHLFEHFLSTTEMCRTSLEKLIDLKENYILRDTKIFDHSLKMSFCINRTSIDDNNPYSYPGNFYCNDCQNAYRNWICSIKLKTFIPHEEEHDKKSNSTKTVYPVSNKDNSFSNNMPKKISFSEIKPCESWCIEVEKLCPYLNPSDETTNGGEPAFLCDESHYNFQSRSKTNELMKRKNLTSVCCYEINDFAPFTLENVAIDSVQNSTEIVNKSQSTSDCSLMPNKCLPSCTNNYALKISSFTQNSFSQTHHQAPSTNDADHQHTYRIRCPIRLILFIFCYFAM